MTPRRNPWFLLIKWLVIVGFAGAALLAATVAFVFWMYGRDPSLPDYQRLSDYHPKQVTAITDANDRRIGEIFSERRTVVPFEKVPPILVDAFVAAEDNKFWTHAGVDYWGMFRAFVTNLRAGHTRQGASTITQQVVKTFLLTPERTFKRKIQEIILARRLETSLTKQEILTLYMNQIYFGHGRYGVEEAARFYFGKHVGQLNTGEAAMLAGLPQSPENISPRKNPRRAKERQTYVLNQLAAMQKIPIAEAQKWIDAPIKIVDRPFPDLGSAPEWVDMVKRELVRMNSGNEAALETLGATVRTTLDPSLQAVAEKALQSGLRAVDKRHGIGRPVRTIKPEKIEAEIARLARKLPRGGPAPRDSYEAVVTQVDDEDRELVVNLGDFPAAVVLGGEDDARFNPPDADGKTRKPSERFKVGDVVSVVVPAAPKAAPKGASEADDDGEPHPRKGPPAAALPKHAKHRVAFSPGPEGAVVILDVRSRKVRALVGGYASKVAGFNRATMAHRQPGSSFKPFVYAAAIDSGKYTPASVVNDAPESFRDFPEWKPKNFETGRYEGPVRLRYALSKSINTVSLQLAYNLKPETIVALARRMGIASQLTPEMSIALGSNEVTPLEHTNAVATLAAGGVAAEPQFVDAIDGKPAAPPHGEQVLRPEVAYVVIDMMRSVVTEGTAARAASLKIPIAGKTGTSNDAKDTWFIGLTPDYAIGVWIGFDEPRPMGHDTGGSNAVPVYVEIMKQMNQPAKPFPRPGHVVEATIDKATGLLAPEGAPKGTAMTEVFLEGTQPTEVAPMPDDVTEENKTKDEYED
ncbi:MAG TPA: PBP1A family penicillin-binding protein [Kofleriaceae bacterium]|nr:PBP1A family penicillin-binding protein [Kofleriaceae bacterium]